MAIPLLSSASMRELDRITIEEYGRTYEDRRLYLLAVTSSKNQRNIDDIRRRHKALCDPEKPVSQWN